MKFFITGGGTGGHVYPGIAVAREITKRDAGHSVLFIGAGAGVETRLVPAEGFKIETLDVSGIKGRGLFAKTASVIKLIKAVGRSRRLIAEHRPDVTLGVGGYASGPMGIASIIAGVPLALAEQNVAPGLTNRWLGKFAKRVFVTWPGSEKRFPKKAGVVTGNPIRPEFFTIRRERSDDRLGILIIGGSQGAKSINRAMLEAAPLLAEIKDQLYVVHQTGKGEAEKTRKVYVDMGLEWTVAEFFTDMPRRLADADFVISRSGAGAVAEICAVGRAALYVPFPFAADDHQTKNAMAMVEAGAAMHMKDAETTGEKIADMVRSFITDRAKLSRMSEMAAKMATPGAAVKIVDELVSLATEAA